MPYFTVGKENSGRHRAFTTKTMARGNPAVVLIHGYPLSGASWEKQVPVLLDAGYRVITYDRRGFGKSSQPTAGYNYDTFAEDLHKLVTQLKLRDFTLVGFSMGGGEVARYFGKYGSGGVSKAVIISGVPPYLLKAADNPEGVDGGVFAGIQRAVAADRYAFFTGFFQNFYNTDAFLGKRVSEQVVQASWNIAASASATASFACVRTWHEDFREDLARVDVPTLVIQGDADRILPITATGLRTAKLIKGARQLIVQDGPHAVNWTHAEEVERRTMLSFPGEKIGNPAAGSCLSYRSCARIHLKASGTHMKLKSSLARQIHYASRSHLFARCASDSKHRPRPGAASPAACRCSGEKSSLSPAVRLTLRQRQASSTLWSSNRLQPTSRYRRT